MDLVDTLRNKIAALDDGEHSSGLQATLGHIEVAFRHLARGQNDGDQAAYTDAIYRTNQAFEGSIKEAYRVLTGKDPQKKTPYSIEEYLEKNSVFRERVLNQFKNYRTEWRNPSAHDYKLDFDESEAFLAIISVSAFACLLSDQIAEKLAFNVSKAATKELVSSGSAGIPSGSLYDQASTIVLNFVSSSQIKKSHGPTTELMLLGSLHGAFASALPNVEVVMEPLLSAESRFRADLLLKWGNEKLIIELKRFSKAGSVVLAREQVERYLDVAGLSEALLVFAPDEAEEAELLEYNSERSNARIGIVMPKSAIVS